MSARNIRLLAGHSFLSDFKFYAPITVLYLESITGSYSSALAVISCILLTSTVAEVPTGLFSDRAGRKMTTLVSAILVAFYIFLLAVATNFWILIAAAVTVGISDALASGNNQALLFESVRQAKEDFNRAFSRMNAASSLGLGLSAIAGGILLAAGASMNSLFWLSLAPQILRIILCLFLTEPGGRSEAYPSNIFHDLTRSFQLFRQRPRLRLLTIAGAIQFGIGEAAHRFGPAFFVTVWPLWAINVFSSMRYAFSAISFWSAPRIIARLGETGVLFAGSGAMALFGIAAAIVQNMASPLLVYANSLFHGPMITAHEHLMQHHYSDAQRATMGSLTELCSSVLTAGSLILLGLIADALGPASAFLTAMLLRLPVLGIYGYLLRKY